MGAESLVHQPHHPRVLLDDGGNQFHHHNHQYACSWHDFLSSAAHHMVAVHRGHPGVAGDSGAHLSAGDAVVRSSLWHHVLPAARRWRTSALATSLLVFRSPRSIHPHPSSDGRGLRRPVHLLSETHLRLSLDGVCHDWHRLSVLDRLGSPYVPEWHEPSAGCVVYHHHHGDRGAVGDQDV